MRTSHDIFLITEEASCHYLDTANWIFAWIVTDSWELLVFLNPIPSPVALHQSVPPLTIIRRIDSFHNIFFINLFLHSLFYLPLSYVAVFHSWPFSSHSYVACKVITAYLQILLPILSPGIFSLDSASLEFSSILKSC